MLNDQDELEEGEVRVHADTSSSDEEGTDRHICDEEKTQIFLQKEFVNGEPHKARFKPGDLIAASAVVHKKYRALNIKPP